MDNFCAPILEALDEKCGLYEHASNNITVHAFNDKIPLSLHTNVSIPAASDIDQQASQAKHLRYLIEENDILAMALLIHHRRIPINTPLSPSGTTALCLAVALQKVEIVRLLLENGATVHPPLTNAFLPLHHAAASGNLVILELLLSAGADIHAMSLGHTALDKAASASIANVLIEEGMLPRELNNAIICQARHGIKNAKDVIGLIVSEGGYVNAVDGKGWTALMWAGKRGDMELAKVLLGCGAKVGKAEEVARDNGFDELVDLMRLSKRSSI